jgi:hypothetical protein
MLKDLKETFAIFVSVWSHKYLASITTPREPTAERIPLSD